MDGAIVLDKPAGMTSFAAVRTVRRLVGGAKVGHLGTLDPAATGVLPVVVGRATRLARFYLDHRREYVARIRFGWSTSTYDAEGRQVGEATQVELDEPALEAALEAFRGRISQMPPPVSAKKVDGVRAYKLARNDEPVELEPAEIEIHALELLEVDGPFATVRCLCSAGTYIRSLAHDLGTALGCGAHVCGLNRTKVGEFELGDAHPLEHLEELHAEDRLEDAVRPPASLVPSLPVERVDAATAARIRHGQDFSVSAFGECATAPLVKAVDPQGHLLCIGEAIAPRCFHPVVVL